MSEPPWLDDFLHFYNMERPVRIVSDGGDGLIVYSVDPTPSYMRLPESFKCWMDRKRWQLEHHIGELEQKREHINNQIETLRTRLLTLQMEVLYDQEG